MSNILCLFHFVFSIKIICPVCDKPVVNLRKHQRRVHENIRPYRCDQCERCFIWPSYLRTHQARVHRETNNQNNDDAVTIGDDDRCETLKIEDIGDDDDRDGDDEQQQQHKMVVVDALYMLVEEILRC